jgi:hypothetical protein
VAQEPEGSSPHSQQPATGPCPETTESNPHHPKPVSLRSILIPSSHLRLGLLSGFFPSGFQFTEHLNYRWISRIDFSDEIVKGASHIWLHTLFRANISGNGISCYFHFYMTGYYVVFHKAEVQCHTRGFCSKLFGSERCSAQRYLKA